MKPAPQPPARIEQAPSRIVRVKRGRDLVYKDSVTDTIWAVIFNYFPERKGDQ